MKILITSGGTTVPIDPVRTISNSSTGRFGAKLARCALIANQEVIYLVSNQGQSPFSYSVNFYTEKDIQNTMHELTQLYQFTEQYKEHYHEHRYHHFDEYQTLLQSILEKEQPDIVILAAAVSDYLVDYAPFKVRSSTDLTLQLKKAPKLIHSVKQWATNCFLVGFKLLVNATDDELILAAQQSIMHNDADLVIANDLASIKQGEHEVIMVERNGSLQKYTDNIATTIIERSLKRWDT